jgi:hypothetical protein
MNNVSRITCQPPREIKLRHVIGLKRRPALSHTSGRKKLGDPRSIYEVVALALYWTITWSSQGCLTSLRNTSEIYRTII